MALNISWQKARQLTARLLDKLAGAPAGVLAGALILTLTTTPCLSQSLAVDKRAEDNAKIFGQYQAELARAQSLANQNPPDAALLFAYAQSLEKVARFMAERARLGQGSPYEDAVRAIKSLTEGQLNSGPKNVNSAGYLEAVKLYDDATQLQGYWVTQLIKRNSAAGFASPADSKNLFNSALKIYQGLVDKNPYNTEWQAAFISANIRTFTGQRQSVHTNFQPTLDLILQLAKDNPKDAQVQRALAAVYARKGSLLVQSTSDNGYVEEWKKEIDVRVGLLNQDEENNLHRAELAAALERNAESFAVMGGGDRAFFALTDAKKLREDLIRREPENLSRIYDLMAVNRALANVRDRYANKVKKARATYLDAMEASMRAQKVEAGEIARARDAAFKSHEDTVELIYLNILQTSHQLVKKTPHALLAQRALVDSYMGLGEFYSSQADTKPKAAKLYADGADNLRLLAGKNPADVGWLFYQIELNIALGFAYATQSRDARSDRTSELLTLLPGDELKLEKDRRYVKKLGSALKEAENGPAHQRDATLSVVANSTYDTVMQLISALLGKTPPLPESKNGAKVPKRREF